MRIIRYLSAVLFCALIGGCSVQPIDEALVVNNNIGGSEKAGREVLITALYDEPDLQGTKTVLNSEGKVLWTPADEIAIMSGDEKAKFTSTNDENVRSATFRGPISFIIGEANEDNPDSYIYGLYPYDEDAILSGGIITTELPSVQTGYAGSFADNLAVAVAKANSFTLPFKNAYSGINFQFSEEGYESVTLSSNNGELISGAITVSFGTDGIPVTSVVSGSSSVTLTAPEGGTFETGKKYYIICAPVTMSEGFTLTAHKSTGNAVFRVNSSFSFNRNEFKSISGYLNERATFESSYVDLGLSVMWATCNLGATSPEEYGDYYAWGETEPYYEDGYAQSSNPVWKAGKESGYTWDSYQWSNGSYNNLTKYNNSSNRGQIDNNFYLDMDDDAANQRYGSYWRIPTDEEWTELYSNCIKTWSSLNGVEGYRFESRINGNSIFLPAGGLRSSTSLSNVGTGGNYWSSSMFTIPSYAYFYSFSLTSYQYYDYTDRNRGLNIRPVYGEIIPVSSITLNQTNITITTGEYTYISITMLPDNATYKSVVWTSSNPDVVVAFSSRTGKAKISGRSPGTAVLTAYSEDMARCLATYEVTVTHSITLNKSSIAISKGNMQQLVATIEPASATSVTWNSSDPSVATVDSEGKVTAIGCGSAQITATNVDGVTATCTVEVVPSTVDEYVDLGGVLWATCNLGATSPEEYGDYYAWGEVVTKNSYTWNSYIWGRYIDPTDDTSYYLTKYNSDSSLGTVDNKTELDPEDDVAHVKLGGYWHIPTNDEWLDLLNACTWTWIEDYNGTGVSGVLGRGNNFNDRCIFLPAAGFMDGSEAYNYGEQAVQCYWSSSLNTIDGLGDENTTVFVPFFSRGIYSPYFDMYLNYRYQGLVVRPVI